MLKQTLVAPDENKNSGKKKKREENTAAIIQTAGQTQGPSVRPSLEEVAESPWRRPQGCLAP